MTTTCRSIELQLTGLPDPGAAVLGTPGLREHLSECVPCRRYFAGLRRLDATIRNLPTAAADPIVRESFLLALPALPPIIERRIVPVRSGSDSYAALSRRVASARSWIGAGTAAAVVLGAGIYLGMSGSRPPAQAVAFRYDLLAKEVSTLALLTKANTPTEKIDVWSEFLADLHAEAALLARGGEAAEMQSLSRMYNKAATEGLAKQAALLPHHWTPAQRRDVLAAADSKLARTEAEAVGQADAAPTHAKATFQSIAAGAKDARARLQSAIRGEAF